MHKTIQELEAGLAEVRMSPAERGVVELIVRRPDVGEREVVDTGVIDTELGLEGDSWSTRGTSPNPKAQITLMNSRSAALIAGTRERWPLAGDQFFVDLDLSAENLPPGTRLRIGGATVEVTDMPHRGCGKFIAHFGESAREFVNSTTGVALNLRGINAMVIAGGTVRPGDAVVKDSAAWNGGVSARPS